ncbi:ATP-dependent DNA helicase RecG [Sphingobium jiangsuense]|uniref:Probable DNA 3'-5' helicase RecG n=1 Tax=Sphingobium jiangsuense TaxID=870476 RepID=A0A7W6BJN7_9SPHN|nr:ATP-dependent DNA helicase RecG [Sphingobium jiangsuense]MBB3927184.1 ATP-dependent DNA helicase RecG [Sphingobium jiangsuense]GLS99536.1 ATP-dependent DNA helicase RecG [Sphingobium jiangsuense]
MRPELLNPLFAEISVLKGVGNALSKPLDRLGLSRMVDLAFHLPTGWVERKRVTRLDPADVGQTIIVTLTPVEYRASGGARAPFRVVAEDEAGNSVSLIYFGRNSGWPRKLLPLNEPKVISGKLEAWGDFLQIVHPDHVSEPREAAAIQVREAVYPLSEGISGARMRDLVGQALERAPELPEWIEPSVLARRGWKDWRASLLSVHATPDSRDARRRIAYDEIFSGQLALMLVRAAARKRKADPLHPTGKLRDLVKLPFAPTGAQLRSLGEIDGDIQQSAPMLRLLQGDVGAGKTWVALMALLGAVESGMQGAMLAPTEILARQHYETLRRMLAGVPVNIAVLTGRDKGKAREATLMGLADGSIDILVGTHAIFQEAVSYKHLGLAVIDEQHRFGVVQRMMLTAKARLNPHVLVMTATPIPRTLTLTYYGDMEVSRLDEMPPGRQSIKTLVMSVDRLDEVIEALGRHISGGEQAYWVCPLVEESEASDQAAAEARAEALRMRFGADKVALVHGRMKGPEKDAVMERFATGQASVLVATTVIEVGVDVPNASLMIIEGADRFGLAQLHQLRGRVGRGDKASTCLLLRGNGLSETARARLALMRESNDGFRIAEEDLKLRGAGDYLGTRQSGDQSFRLATPEDIGELIDMARDDARLLVERDGGLASERGQAARICLYLFERDAAVGLLKAG